MKREDFYIQGMSCTACSSGIESAFKRKKGIEEIRVDLLNQNAVVVFDESLISLEEIFSFIQKLGYKPKKQGLIEKMDFVFLTPKRRIILAFLFTLPPLLLSMLPMLHLSLPLSFEENFFIQMFCSLVVMHMGRRFYLRGFQTLISFHPTMDTLVMLGSGTAFIYSLFSFSNPEHLYFESVCVIVLFVLIGKSIEEKAKQNTQSSLLSLLAFKENTAILLTSDGEKQVRLQDIKIGDILKITPQSIIPTDGIITQGYANLDLSSLSGESMPITKKKGETLLSGSLNLNTTFLMRSTQKAKDSTYWQILDVVQNALISKAPIAKIADKVALYFVPSVIVLAFFVFLIWMISTHNFALSMQMFCSVLLVSCPCSLGLATPMALNIASNLASQKGIFFKDARILELIGKTQTIFFDKTGTLTQKNLNIKKIVSLSSLSQNELLQICASLEKESSHIIAQSILAKTQFIPLLETSNISIQEGFGVCGMIGLQTYKIGNAKNFTPSPSINEDGILIFIGTSNQEKDEILGYILLEEELKVDAKTSINLLKQQKITPILLSGDRKANAQKIAEELDIACIADALPQDKLNAIAQYKESVTMMVGDGINDLLAFCQSDISVSMGEGSKEAIASSNLIIFNNELKNINYAIFLSQATLRNIKQNLFWAFGYNLLIIPLACGIFYEAGVYLTPMLASIAMTLSSLSVTLNAQRLNHFKG